jgi:hypothetical protein
MLGRNTQNLDGVKLQPRTKQSRMPSVSRGISDPSAITYAQIAQSTEPRITVESLDAIGPAAYLTRSCPELPTPTRKTSDARPAMERHESIEVESRSPSVFDVESDQDQDAMSDFNTDISGSSVADLSLPPELDSDRRLLNPKQYFSELEELESSVAANSGLFLMAQEKRQAYPKSSGRMNPSPFNLKVTFESHCSAGMTSGLKSYDDAVMNFCRSRISSATSQNDLKFWAFHLLECRNLMLATVSNIERLKMADFCTTSVNALGLDPQRRNVARLVPIRLSAVYELHQTFEDLLESLTTNQAPSSLPQAKLDTITEKCGEILEDLGLPRSIRPTSLWRQAVLVLDLAVVSYCGAHIERFDHRFLGESLDLAKITAAWTEVVDGSEGIMLRRRSLRCLNGFLRGEQVWVFQPQNIWQDASDLWLSATIEEFGDIWGPVWAIKTSEDATEAIKYNTGNGSIVPWQREKDTPLATDETYCHWASEFVRVPPSSQTFTPGLKLLIGGNHAIVEQKTSQLKENQVCQNRTNNVIQRLKATNHLTYLGTRSEKRYLAEEQVTAGVGAYGVAITSGRVYKKRRGITLKEAICEAWKNGGGKRNPAILEHWLGVEFSFCTGNARRCRLKTLFNSSSVRRWLDSCKDHAEPFPCEKAFYEALDSPHPWAFRELYTQHREWRRDLGKLVHWCLEGLRESRVDSEEGTLYALWVPRWDKRTQETTGPDSDSAMPFLVKVRQGTHSWTPFLEDTETSCSFSILSGKCLVTDYKDGAVCQARRWHGYPHYGAPVLETALVVNQHREAPRPKMLELRSGEAQKSKQARWSISRIPYNENFRLAGGRLTVVEPFRNIRLVVKYDVGIFTKLVKQTRQQMFKAVSKREELYHWELKDEDDWDVKPVPLFVISEYKYK